VTDLPKTIVTLSDDEIAECDEFARRIRARYMTGDKISALPRTSHLLTLDEFKAWVATREDAGRNIDIDTCELDWWYAEEQDPYGLLRALGQELNSCINRVRFVRDPQSRGWVCLFDLPEDKVKAMHDRADRERSSKP
jgi:hypothetical protein